MGDEIEEGRDRMATFERFSSPASPLLSLYSPLKSPVSPPGADVDLSAAREAGRINFARAKEHLAKYLISPMVLRATVQIRHQGVLPHFPDQGHRHPLAIVETRTARLPSIHHADIARQSKFRHRMTSDIPDGGILWLSRYLFATRYRDNDSPSSDGHRSLRG